MSHAESLLPAAASTRGSRGRRVSSGMNPSTTSDAHGERISRDPAAAHCTGKYTRFALLAMTPLLLVVLPGKEWDAGAGTEMPVALPYLLNPI
eukprot:SAG11_NODE_17532_length_515_cov_2.230769_1_plen_92_part_01